MLQRTLPGGRWGGVVQSALRRHTFKSLSVVLAVCRWPLVASRLLCQNVKSNSGVNDERFLLVLNQRTSEKQGSQTPHGRLQSTGPRCFWIASTPEVLCYCIFFFFCLWLLCVSSKGIYTWSAIKAAGAPPRTQRGPRAAPRKTESAEIQKWNDDGTALGMEWMGETSVYLTNRNARNGRKTERLGVESHKVKATWRPFGIRASASSVSNWRGLQQSSLFFFSFFSFYILQNYYSHSMESKTTTNDNKNNNNNN